MPNAEHKDILVVSNYQQSPEETSLLSPHQRERLELILEYAWKVAQWQNGITPTAEQLMERFRDDLTKLGFPGAHTPKSSKPREYLRPEVMEKLGITSFDPNKVTVHGQNIRFAPKEFVLLYRLAQVPGLTVEKPALIQLLGQNKSAHLTTDDHLLAVHIDRIRAKLRSLEEPASFTINTIRGVGFQLDSISSQESAA